MISIEFCGKSAYLAFYSGLHIENIIHKMNIKLISELTFLLVSYFINLHIHNLLFFFVG